MFQTYISWIKMGGASFYIFLSYRTTNKWLFNQKDKEKNLTETSKRSH